MPDHPYYGISLHSLARIYHKLGEDDLALENELLSIDIQKRSVDPHNLGLGYAYLNLARIYHKIHRDEDAANSSNQAEACFINYPDKLKEIENTDSLKKSLNRC